MGIAVAGESHTQQHQLISITRTIYAIVTFTVTNLRAKGSVVQYYRCKTNGDANGLLLWRQPRLIYWIDISKAKLARRSSYGNNIFLHHC